MKISKDALQEAPDTWLGLSTKEVYSELEKMGIDNPRGKWWKNYRYSHPARVKYREWYKAKKSGKNIAPDKKEAERAEAAAAEEAARIEAARLEAERVAAEEAARIEAERIAAEKEAEAARLRARQERSDRIKRRQAARKKNRAKRKKTWKDYVPSAIRFESGAPKIKSMRDMIIEEYYAILSERANQSCPPGPSQADCERKRAENRKKYCAKNPDAKGCEGLSEKKFSSKKDNQKMKIKKSILEKIIKQELDALMQEAEHKIVCPNCGTHNHHGVDKCSNCGHPRNKGNWKKA